MTFLDTRSGGRDNIRFFPLLLALFLASRLWLLLVYQPAYSDTSIYAEYAAAWHHATDLEDFFTTILFEYPPLALLPILGAFSLADLFGDVTLTTFRLSFRALAFLAETAAFLTLPSLLHAYVPSESAKRHSIRLLCVAILLPLLLPDLLYDRLDIFVFAILTFMIWSFTRRRYGIAAFLLGLAAAFKITPLILVPLFILLFSRAQAWRDLRLRKTALLGGLLGFLLGFLPFSILAGNAAFRFVSYHTARGLHIESLPGDIPLLASLFGFPLTVQFKWGAPHLAFPGSELAGPAASLLALAALFAFYLACWHRRATEADFPFQALLAFLIAFCTTKVLSPQYFVWLFPFLLCLPLKGKSLYRVYLLFAILFGLTYLVFPTFFVSMVSLEPLGICLVVIRNVVLLTITSLMAVRYFYPSLRS